MSWLELFVIAVGLAMDAFAVSICKGLTLERAKWSDSLTAGLYFGLFQGLMPFAGFCLGTRFQHLIVNIDHWIAWAFLCLIGGNMILESRGESDCQDSSFRFTVMLPLAIATSIDALAVGVTFAFFDVDIYRAMFLIALIAFLLSSAGIKIGNIFGRKFQSKAEVFGGIVLIFMGFKILLEHLGVFSYVGG